VSAAVETSALAPTTSSDLFGVRCFAGTLDGAVECVVDRVLSRLGGYAVLCNVHVLMSAQERLDVHRAVDDAWLVFPDGAPVAWLQRRLGAPTAERVGGPDLMFRVLDQGRERRLRHVFVGSTDPTLERLSDRIRAQLRGVEIVGTLAPPFDDASQWSDEAIARIRAWQPDIIWLALGAPKQEMWMREHAAAVAPALVIGVGAAFDFHAETKKRAPEWVQRAGLEWAHRLASEPRRLAGRYVTTNAAFLVKTAQVLALPKPKAQPARAVLVPSTEAGTSTRSGFVAAVAQTFKDAGISHVFLHNVGEEALPDSDLDLAVARESLVAVDTIVRSGKLGRLLQRFDYDVPWCRYYVIDTGEPGRRLRQLDIACDPFGIGRYGDAVQSALEHAQPVDGLSALSSAATVVYLAAKRGRKGIRGPDDLHQLQTEFKADPAGASRLLQAAFDEPGAALARALADGSDPTTALRSIGSLIGASRRRPWRLALRAWFGAARIVRRLRRPTGLLVSVVGPDGTGKTTLADGLELASDGLFRGARRLHLSPGLLPPPGRLLRRPPPADTSQPQSRPPSAPAGSIARIGYLAADTLIGWIPSVSWAKARATLVVLERGWDDLAVDPRRYRLGAGARLVQLGKRVLPHPDLTLLLEAPAEEVHARKPELAVAEIDRQLTAWRTLAQAEPDRFASVTATTKEDTLAAATEAVENRLAGRLGDLGRFTTALSCLGRPSTSGARFSVVSGRGHPRWIIPHRRGAAGPVGTKLYRPSSQLQRLGAGALEVASRAGLPGQPELALDTSDGLGPEIAAALGLDEVELAAMLSTDTRRGSRAVLTVMHRGRPVAVTKVAAQGSQELKTELRMLNALESAPLRSIVTPRVLGSFPWRGLDVVAMTVLDHRGQTSRSLGPVEANALVELYELADRLKPEAAADGRVVAHGDFCGWNTSVLHNGKLAIWDWEWAHLGEPLEDWFHWETQRLVAFGALSPDEIVRQAFTPGPAARQLCERLGLEWAAAAPTALMASLRHGITRLNGSTGRELEVRTRMLELVEGLS
jgi:N-acetylglucosaminyldiphosphoundecaprenol N-acetyl-beta-D-mannosaminyltransferase